MDFNGINSIVETGLRDVGAADCPSDESDEVEDEDVSEWIRLRI